MVIEYACFLREMENWGSDLQPQVKKGIFLYLILEMVFFLLYNS